MTTTDSEVPLKTDMSIATGKETTVTTDTSTTSMKPVRSEDDRSIETDDLAAEAEEELKPILYDDVPHFTPPLRINATRVPERLSGSLSTIQVPMQFAPFRRRLSDSAAMSSRSGSRSPGTHNFDGGSSISSLEDAGIDTDLLTDRMGRLELDLKETQQLTHELNKSLSNLPPVAERLSEETLEDCHAFSDLKREGTVSRGGSITTGGEVSSSVLEPLDEVEDEDSNEGGKVKITNMEEILEGVEEDADVSPPPPTI